MTTASPPPEPPPVREARYPRWITWGLAMLFGLFVLLLLGRWAFGAQLDANTTTQGLLTPTPQAATGASANSVRFGRTKFRGVTFTLWTTAGTATVQLEVSCVPAPTGPIWAALGTPQNLTTTASVALDIQYPGCEYRTNVTACSTCAVNTFFFAKPEMQ